MNDLASARQRRILALVVQDYVESAQPVGSAALVRRHDLPVSPATVRNELAALEDQGYLMQPHTSAGRVPTVAGYRYFVEHLVERSELSRAERRTIRHQFHQAAWDLDRWLRLSAAVLARNCGVAGLVAARQDRRAPLLRVDLIDLGDGLLQLVGLMQGGLVRQFRWRPELAYDADMLLRAVAGVNARLARDAANQDSDPAGAADAATDLLDPFEASVAEAVEQLVAGPAAGEPQELYHAGLTQILHQPEFADSERLRSVVELLEHGLGLEPIARRLPADGVQVIIGGEPPLEQVPYITLVLARFGPPQETGLLGVVGPTRMPYERAVPTVGFVARLMTRLMAGEVA